MKAKIYSSTTMFNLYITAYGLFPRTISVPARQYAQALRHYRTALRATAAHQATNGDLQSIYGFSFRVSSSRSRGNSSVSLALPQNVNRRAVATALGTRNARIEQRRNGDIVVTDPFNITWTIVHLWVIFKNQIPVSMHKVFALTIVALP